MSRNFNWYRKNGLFLDPVKFSSITFLRKSVFGYLNYVIDFVTLNEVDSITDLGINFDSKLNFHKYIIVYKVI